MPGRKTEQEIEIAGRSVRVSNLDKVLYPETGTTKGAVLGYYLRIADVMIQHAAWRPATRKRWVDGVGTAQRPCKAFFRKDLEDSAPSWVPTATIEHQTHVNTYPLINEPAVLAWMGQMAALELHVPQWRFTRSGVARNPDRLVLDLDPGPGTGLVDCARAALICRESLQDMGLESFPVTSGSKGIHLYAGLDRSRTSDEMVAVAKELAVSLQRDHPKLIVANMKKSLREGKVLIDWSQNNASKTTVAPYSLRGRTHPTVAAPRTWDEIERPGLRQLEFSEVLERVDSGLEPLARLVNGV